MITKQSNSSVPWLAVFDLDGTLTWRDTLMPYLGGFLLRHPWRIVRLWPSPYLFYRYWRDRNRGALKSGVIRMAMGGASRSAVDAWTEHYVASLKPGHRFRALALGVVDTHRAAGDHLLLMSASPDLYVPRIAQLLGFERTVCTQIRWQGDRLDGRLASENVHGEEKLRRLHALRRDYPGVPVIAYGNASSDLDHMREADKALLVNGNSEARLLAKKSAIEVSSWT
jgi:phosphatidylglycerophosphatase C